MNALINSCAALWSGDGMEGPPTYRFALGTPDSQGPLWRTMERPGSPFADTPALLDVKEQEESDKNDDDRIAAAAAREREQAAVEARRRDSRLSSQTEHVTAALGFAGSGGRGPQTREEVFGDPDLKTSGLGDGPTPVPGGLPSVGLTLPQAGGFEAATQRTLSAQGPSSAEEGLGQNAVRRHGDPRGVRSNTAQAGTHPDSSAHARGRSRQANEGGGGPMAAAAKLQVLSKAHPWAQTSGSALSKAPLSGRHAAVWRGTSGLGDGPTPVPSRFAFGGLTTPKAGGFEAATRAGIDATSSGAKEMPPAHARDGASPLSESPFPSSGHPDGAVSRVSAHTQMPGSTSAGAAESPVRDVGEQILDSLRASVMQGDRQVIIRLQPPELGTIVVRLREQDRHLEGSLEVGETDTRLEIEQALPEVVRSLQEAGIPIRRFEVTTDTLSEQDTGRELPQQDGGAGQDNGNQGRESLSVSWASHALGDGNSAAASDPAQSNERRGNVSGSRIDLLL